MFIIGSLVTAVEYQAQEAAGWNGDGPVSPFVVVSAIAGPTLIVLGLLGAIATWIVVATIRRRFTL